MGRLKTHLIKILNKHKYSKPAVCIEIGTWEGTQLIICANYMC